MAYESGAGKSDAWRKKEMEKIIKGLKDGSIKAPLPSDISGPHWKVKKKNNKDMQIAQSNKETMGEKYRKVKKTKQKQKKTIQAILDEMNK